MIRKRILIPAFTAAAFITAGAVGISARQWVWTNFSEQDGAAFLQSQGYEVLSGGESGNIFFNNCPRGSLSREYTTVKDGRVKENATVCYSWWRGAHGPIIDW